MAAASLTASLWGRCSLMCSVVFLQLFLHAICYTPDMLRVTCRETYDLRGRKMDSGIVISELPDHIPNYPNEDQFCDIFFSFSEGSDMVFYFEDLDLHSSSGASKCDSTNVEFFDGSSGVKVKGLEHKVCGRIEEMPTDVYTVENQLLIIRANSNGKVQGSGFKIHFTVYRRGYPCNREEFSCDDYDGHSGSSTGFKRCVSKDLVCDEWNDCGDWADERQNCNDLTAGAIAAIVLVALGILALVVGLIVFCKIRRQREVKRIGEKETAAAMRDTSFSSSRQGGGGGFMSPFSISNETLEKEKYTPRYSTGRNSSRSRGGGPGQAPSTRAPDYEENPPPYTEKPSFDRSRSDDEGLEEERPRSRQKRRERGEVFDEGGEEDAPVRARHGRTRSQDRDDRYPSRDERQPYRRDDPDFDRYSRDRDDRRPVRDDRYPSRRDDQDSPPALRRNDRDRPPSRHDQRDRDRDRYDDRDRDRESRERDRDRPRNDETDRDRRDDRERSRERDRDRPRNDERDRDRRDDRDRDPRRERPTSQRGAPEDRYSSGREDDPLDQLHPLREVRRSVIQDSDHDTSRDEKDLPPSDQERLRDDRRSRDRDDRPRPDLYPPPRDDRSASPRGSDREDSRPPRDDRPRGSYRDDRPERRRGEPPSSQHRPRSGNPEESYEEVGFPGGRRNPRDSPPLPPPPPPVAPPEEDLEDSPPRNRRRRSRSREGQDRSRGSRGGFKEQSV